MRHDRPILITGATGYIGGRLVPQLLEQGYRVRCLARDPRKLSGRGWDEDPRVEIVRGDVLDRESVRAAMDGCGAAYYLVHSMLARRAGLRGPGPRRPPRTSPPPPTAAGLGADHLPRRAGPPGREALAPPGEPPRGRRRPPARAGCPSPSSRAAMIVGSGSASFEMLRSLVSKLPVMICPGGSRPGPSRSPSATCWPT